MSKTHIVGAGLSGMVAAINLAREGRDVLVLDQAPKIGGSRVFHPSIHTTPINHEMLWDYIGIDASTSFHNVKSMEITVGDKCYVLNPSVLYCVERGSRATSIDSDLYDKAREAGVKFEFNSGVTKVRDVPPGSIISTGLHGGMFDALSVPSITLNCHAVSFPSRLEDVATVYFDDYSNDYFYATSMNGLWYGMVFSRKPMKEDELHKCAMQLYEREGVRHGGWMDFTCRVPLAQADNPRLFAGDHILAGAIAGYMDPFACFGIHGALLSGKVAAMAVTDPEKALREHKRFMRYFRQTYYAKKISDMVPFRVKLAQLGMLVPWLVKPAMRLFDRGIPGIPDHRLGKMLDAKGISRRTDKP